MAYCNFGTFKCVVIWVYIYFFFALKPLTLVVLPLPSLALGLAADPVPNHGTEEAESQETGQSRSGHCE